MGIIQVHSSAEAYIAKQQPPTDKGTSLISLSSPTTKPALPSSHEQWMRRAIAEAGKAQTKSEVPIGCVIVQHGKIIARGTICVKRVRTLPDMPS